MKLETIDSKIKPIHVAASSGAQRVQVAIVKSDDATVAALDRDLRRRGFEVTRHDCSDRALNTLLANAPDIALFDLRDQDDDSFAVFLRLRDHSTMPVILLTDSADEVEEIVGLRMGADAVVRKPWSPQLLAERIRALSRRARLANGATAGGEGQLDRPPLTMDGNRMVAAWRGRPLDLTSTEFKLLHALAERPGYVRTRDFLMDRLYGTEIFVLDRTVDSHVKRLRKKLRDLDPGFEAIETLYGTGYRLNLPDAEGDASARRLT